MHVSTSHGHAHPMYVCAHMYTITHMHVHKAMYVRTLQDVSENSTPVTYTYIEYWANCGPSS